MAKKYKSKNNQPNAPNLQTILLQSPAGQQPPHNPYYPDLSQTAPPPYTDLSATTTRMSNIYDNNNPRYQRINNNGPPTIIVQQPIAAAATSFAYSHYCEKVRSYNKGIIYTSVIAILMSYLTIYLYAQRPCVDEFVIHQPSPDLILTVRMLKSLSTDVIYLSVLLLGVSLVKSLIGYNKSSGCFLFIVTILTFMGMMLTGYMAYLSFFSPCVVSLNEIITKSFKTMATQVASAFHGITSGPEKGSFGETNVFQYINEDKYGVIIFIINVYLCLCFISNFCGAISNC